ncbi:MAG: hypothetical protein DMG59_28260, partial [Acidobacteria bacterium]
MSVPGSTTEPGRFTSERTTFASLAAIGSVLIASSCCLPILPFNDGQRVLPRVRLRRRSAEAALPVRRTPVPETPSAAADRSLQEEAARLIESASNLFHRA